MLVAVVVGARKRSSVRDRNCPVHGDNRRIVRSHEAAKISKCICKTEENFENIQKDDKFLVSTIVVGLKSRYRDLHIVSYACDDGVGKIVKEVCIDKEVKFGEIVWYFHGEKRWEPSETAVAYLKRNATCFEFGDLFVVLAQTPDNERDKRKGMVEDLVERLKNQMKTNPEEARPFIVLNEEGKTLESYKESAII